MNVESGNISQSRRKGPFSGEKGPLTKTNDGSRASCLFCYRYPST